MVYFLAIQVTMESYKGSEEEIYEQIQVHPSACSCKLG